MTPEEHKDGIIRRLSVLVDKKYTQGQQEHGGFLWKKRGLIDMAIDEAIDQVVYLLTLKQQLEEAGIELGEIHEDQQDS